MKIRKFKVIMAESVEEVASLWVPQEIKLDINQYNNWLSDVTFGELTVKLKAGILCYISTVDAETYRVITGQCDNGDIVHHVYKVILKPAIQTLNQ